MPSRYDAGTRAKAVRLVRDHAGDYETEWAAMTAISAWLGMSAETLRKWVLCRRRHKIHYADLGIMPMRLAPALVRAALRGVEIGIISATP